MVLQSSSTRKQRGIMLHWFRAHSGSLQIAWEIRLAQDDAGSRQAGSRHGAGEAECVPSKLKPDCWLIHWLPLIVHHEEEEENRDDCRKGNNESPCALVCCDSMCLGCVRAFSLCVGVWMYHREQGWFSPKHPQQLLRVHPSDLTYNCTNYLTTSITYISPLMRTIHFSRFRSNQLKP